MRGGPKIIVISKVVNRKSRLGQRLNFFHHSSYNNYTNLADTRVLAFLIPLFPVSTSNASFSNVSSNNIYSGVNDFIKQKLYKNVQNGTLFPKDKSQSGNSVCMPPKKGGQCAKNESNEKEAKNAQNSSDITNDISPNAAKDVARSICDTTGAKGIEQDIDKIFIGKGWQHLKTYNLNTNPLLEVPKTSYKLPLDTERRSQWVAYDPFELNPEILTSPGSEDKTEGAEGTEEETAVTEVAVTTEGKEAEETGKEEKESGASKEESALIQSPYLPFYSLNSEVYQFDTQYQMSLPLLYQQKDIIFYKTEEAAENNKAFLASNSILQQTLLLVQIACSAYSQNELESGWYSKQVSLNNILKQINQPDYTFELISWNEDELQGMKITYGRYVLFQYVYANHNQQYLLNAFLSKQLFESLLHKLDINDMNELFAPNTLQQLRKLFSGQNEIGLLPLGNLGYNINIVADLSQQAPSQFTIQNVVKEQAFNTVQPHGLYGNEDANQVVNALTSYSQGNEHTLTDRTYNTQNLVCIEHIISIRTFCYANKGGFNPVSLKSEFEIYNGILESCHYAFLGSNSILQQTLSFVQISAEGFGIKEIALIGILIGAVKVLRAAHHNGKSPGNADKVLVPITKQGQHPEQLNLNNIFSLTFWNEDEWQRIKITNYDQNVLLQYMYANHNQQYGLNVVLPKQLFESLLRKLDMNELFAQNTLQQWSKLFSGQNEIGLLPLGGEYGMKMVKGLSEQAFRQSFIQPAIKASVHSLVQTPTFQPKFEQIEYLPTYWEGKVSTSYGQGQPLRMYRSLQTDTEGTENSDVEEGNNQNVEIVQTDSSIDGESNPSFQQHLGGHSIQGNGHWYSDALLREGLSDDEEVIQEPLFPSTAPSLLCCGNKSNQEGDKKCIIFGDHDNNGGGTLVGKVAIMLGDVHKKHGNIVPEIKWVVTEFSHKIVIDTLSFGTHKEVAYLGIQSLQSGGCVPLTLEVMQNLAPAFSGQTLSMQVVQLDNGVWHAQIGITNFKSLQQQLLAEQLVSGQFSPLSENTAFLSTFPTEVVVVGNQPAGEPTISYTPGGAVNEWALVLPGGQGRQNYQPAQSFPGDSSGYSISQWIENVCHFGWRGIFQSDKIEQLKSMSIKSGAKTGDSSINKIYRAVAKGLHPDKDGNPEEMVQLNGIKEELDKTISQVLSEKYDLTGKVQWLSNIAHKGVVVLKTVDSAVDGWKLWNEPTAENALRVGLDAGHLYSLADMPKAGWVSVGTSALPISYAVYQGEYWHAGVMTAETIAYIALPYVLGAIPVIGQGAVVVYTVGMAGYAGYSLYNEISSWYYSDITSKQLALPGDKTSETDVSDITNIISVSINPLENSAGTGYGGEDLYKYHKLLFDISVGITPADGFDA